VHLKGYSFATVILISILAIGNVNARSALSDELDAFTDERRLAVVVMETSRGGKDSLLDSEGVLGFGRAKDKGRVGAVVQPDNMFHVGREIAAVIGICIAVSSNAESG